MDLLELYCLADGCDYTEQSRDEDYLAKQIHSHENVFPGHQVWVDTIEEVDGTSTLGAVILTGSNENRKGIR